jgi:hypothetical protein
LRFVCGRYTITTDIRHNYCHYVTLSGIDFDMTCWLSARSRWLVSLSVFGLPMQARLGFRLRALFGQFCAPTPPFGHAPPHLLVVRGA